MDLNNDGTTNLQDIKAPFDRNGDGKLTIDDVKMLYADMHFSSVKSSKNIIPFLITQPMGWLALLVSAVSIYASFNYYGTILPKGGLVFGIAMSLVAFMAIFAINYYTSLKWNLADSGAKLIALFVIGVISLANIVAYTGLLSYERDREDTRVRHVAEANKADASEFKSVIADRNKMLKAGRPRSVKSVTRDLTIANKAMIKVRGTRWRRAVRACPGLKNRKSCRKWYALNEELARAEEWEGLVEAKARLDAKGLGLSTTETITKDGIHVETVVSVTGLDKKYVESNIDMWMATLLEALIACILYLVTRQARARQARAYDAAMAMLRATDGIEPVAVEEQPAMLKKVAADMKAAVDRSQSVNSAVSAIQKVVAAPTPVAAPAPTPVAAPVAPAAVASPIINGAQAQVERWRQHALSPAEGFWMKEEDAYASFVEWAAGRGVTPVPEAGPTGFHASVRAIGALKPLGRNGMAGYTGYARKKAIAA